MQKNITYNSKGFTLIEIMVSISIFTVLMVMGITALLSSNTSHRRAEGLRSAVDNLNFIMDDISRTARTGGSYHCGILSGSIDVPQDCSPTTHGLSLAIEGQDGDTTSPGKADDQIVYRIVQPSAGSNDAYIEKSDSSGMSGTWYRLSTPEVVFDASTSGFVVMNTASTSDKPYLVIHLAGTIQFKGTTMPFALQTTVSQRSD